MFHERNMRNGAKDEKAADKKVHAVLSAEYGRSPAFLNSEKKKDQGRFTHATNRPGRLSTA